MGTTDEHRQSGMDSEQVRQLISTRIDGAEVTVAGGDGKFEVTVVSEKFRGLDTISRHQLVYAAVNREIADGAIHALSIRAHVPGE